jgi:TctA family transporter
LRAVFGIVSLLIALAVVAFVARTQMRATAVAGSAGVVPAQGATVASQAASIEDKARADVARALQEGARRTEDADR